jgi:hypothetical protein
MIRGKPTGLLLVSAQACILSLGCVYSDYRFVYHVSGRVVDAARREPLANCRIAVRHDDFDPRQGGHNWFTSTDDNGRFQNEFGTGIAWGDTRFLGIRVAGATQPPTPPALSEVFLAIHRPCGDWGTQHVTLSPKQQMRHAAGERWIDLGTIEIAAQADSASRTSD